MDHQSSPNFVPPKARKLSVQLETNGQTRVDEYQWLQQRANKDVSAYLQAENSYTDAVMADTCALQETLFNELKNRIKEDDESVPYLWHGYEYFSRTIKDKDYAVHLRRRPDGEESVILDVNSLASGFDYYDVGFLAVSPDSQLLAWTEDTDGSENWSIRVRNLASGEALADTLTGCAADLVWHADSQGFWYLRLDENRRPWQLCSYRLGQSADSQVLLEEPDERFYLGLSLARSEDRLFIISGSIDTSECYQCSVDEPGVKPELILARQQGHEYYPDYDGQRLLIRTNDQGIYYRLVEASPANPQLWQEVVRHRKGITLEDYEIFSDHLVLFERENGLESVRILAKDGESQTLIFPDEAWTVHSTDNAEADADFLRIGYESLNRPYSIIDVDLKSGKQTTRKQMPVLGGFESSDYQTLRIEVVSHDGVKVPVSVVGRKDSFDRSSPLMLYGYGAYGSSQDPYFSSARINLLDRGMLFTLAHIRGGGDLGEDWYRSGRRMQKKNTFEDFIACAEGLISEGLTTDRQLFISGGSAGGLLVGAVLNQRPELFGGALLDVPFVDVLNTMLNPELPLTVTEYDEWGNPEEPAVYDYIASYSPYDNIRNTIYPPILVQAGLEDSRVQYWEPAKWVARMREMKTDNNPLLLKTRMDTGHGGASGRYDGMRECAFDQAFILKTMGLTDG